MTATESSRRALRMTWSKTRRGTECGRSTALTRTLVSNTARNSFVIEQRLQNLWRQPGGGRFRADVVHDLLQRSRRKGRQLAQSKPQQQCPLLAFFGRRLGNCFRSFGVQVDRHCGGNHCYCSLRTRGAAMKVYTKC